MRASPDPTSYDEQIGMTFTQSFTSIAYNVTAIEQSDSSSGAGPAYLLNGLSDRGYWYQVGLSWNWPYTSNGHAAGFEMNYEVFDSTGTSVFPSDGTGGMLAFSGPVHARDTVLLNLYFTSSNTVVMLVKDYTTGAQASETYNAEGGSRFVGLTKPTNSNGFFTGLMTEWYHSAAFYSNISPVIYSNPEFALTSASMWIDEFSCANASCSNVNVLFSDSTPGPVSYSDPSQLHEFASHGATEFSSAYKLITGPAYLSLTVSYSVIGGGAGYGQPAFRYYYNSAIHTVALTVSPNSYTVDAVSSWSVSSTLPGSSQSERWITSTSSGEATSSTTLNFEFQHQYMLSVSGGSGGPDGSGWYASGAAAIASSLGAYARLDGTGQRVASYSVDGQIFTISPTAGTVSVSVQMNSPHQVDFASVQQFEVTLDAGAAEALRSLTLPTIGGDTYWYDSGTNVTMEYAHAWNITAGQSRIVATGYARNGQAVVVVPESGNGTFVVEFVANSPQSIDVKYATQFFTQFVITNASGSKTLDSVSVQVLVNGETKEVEGLTAWLDDGSVFTVSNLTYGKVNVAPTPQKQYTVSGPTTVSLKALVYDASVKVTDYLQLPVAGAKVEVTLVNGTILVGRTDSSGILVFPSIPLGNYTVRVTNLGLTSRASEDASSVPVASIRVPLSAATLALIAGVGGAVGISALVVRNRSRKHQEPPSPDDQGNSPGTGVLGAS